MQLPFLFVHGALVWKILLVALVGASLGTVAVIRRVLARFETRATLAALARTATSIAEGDVVLRGKIAKGAATTVSQDDADRCERTNHLALIVEGEVIYIDGDILVTHGSRSAGWWLRAPRSISSSLGAKSLRAGVVHTVSRGDEVIVRGTLARRSVEEAGYREPASAWCLTSGAVPMTIAATHARPQKLPLGLGRCMVGICLFASIWYGVLHHVGTRALDQSYATETRRNELDPVGPLAIAAAMPGSRREAFGALPLILESRFDQTEDALQLRLRLLDDQGACPVDVLVELRRYEEALELARRCEPASQAWILAVLGRYREAATHAPPGSELGIKLAILEGRWRDAASGIEAFSTRRTDLEAADRVAAQASAQCVAILFRAWAGERTSFDLVANLDTGGCDIAQALAVPPDQQRRFFTAASNRGDRWTDEVPLFASFTGLGDRMQDDTLSSSTWDRNVAWIYAAPFGVRVERDPQSLGRIRRRLALLALYRGDLEAARRELAESRSIDPDGKTASLELTVDLFDASKPVPDAARLRDVDYTVEQIASARRGQIPDEVYTVFTYPDGASLAHELRQAANGHGHALAAHLRASKSSLIGVPAELFGVLPRVTQNRAELATELRNLREPFAGATYRFERDTFRFIDRAWHYRELARMIGDTREAARWAAIYARHAEPLADRQKLIALLLWDRL